MDTFSAFSMALANSGKPLKVFDWDKAARHIKNNKVKNAYAGLSGDFEWTGGDILIDGKPVEKDKTYTYLASTWATPLLVLLDTDDEITCWKYQKDTDDWDAETYWPQSALDILNEKE